MRPEMIRALAQTGVINGFLHLIWPLNLDQLLVLNSSKRWNINIAII